MKKLLKNAFQKSPKAKLPPPFRLYATNVKGIQRYQSRQTEIVKSDHEIIFLYLLIRSVCCETVWHCAEDKDCLTDPGLRLGAVGCPKQ